MRGFRSLIMKRLSYHRGEFLNVNIDPNSTGPWGLSDLEAVLGKGENRGEVERHDYIGGESQYIQEYGPFVFKCNCIAVKGGIGGDLYLKACTPEHQALKPNWTP